MAETRRNWIQWFAVGALCLSVRAVAFAQSSPAGPGSPRTVQISSVPSGSLAGRLTDLHSAPLAGVSVVLRNQATGVEARTTTAKNGAFRFASLDAGEYTLEADAAQLGRGQLEGILITGGNEARVQAAMRFEPAAPSLLEAAAPTRIAVPSAAATPMPLAASALPAAPAAAPKSVVASAAPASAPSRASSTAQSAAAGTQLSAANPAVAAGTALVASRPALSTSRPVPTASIATEPPRSIALTASRDTDGMRPSAHASSSVRDGNAIGRNAVRACRCAYAHPPPRIRRGSRLRRGSSASRQPRRQPC